MNLLRKLKMEENKDFNTVAIMPHSKNISKQTFIVAIQVGARDITFIDFSSDNNCVLQEYQDCNIESAWKSLEEDYRVLGWTTKEKIVSILNED